MGGCPRTPLEMSWGRIRAPCPPFGGGPKIAFFSYLPFMEISSVQKRQFFPSSEMGDMDSVCTSITPPRLILGTPVGLTHAEIPPCRDPKFQKNSHSAYLCMCEPYRGAQNQPWRCNRGAYGIHVPHLGGRKKLPFLDTGNFHKRQVAKKGNFWASPEWGTWSPYAPPSHLQGCPGAPPHRSHMQRYGDSGYL